MVVYTETIEWRKIGSLDEIPANDRFMSKTVMTWSAEAGVVLAYVERGDAKGQYWYPEHAEALEIFPLPTPTHWAPMPNGPALSG